MENIDRDSPHVDEAILPDSGSSNLHRSQLFADGGTSIYAGVVAHNGILSAVVSMKRQNENAATAIVARRKTDC
jgi:hypothetical protein